MARVAQIKKGATIRTAEGRQYLVLSRKPQRQGEVLVVMVRPNVGRGFDLLFTEADARVWTVA
jgi:hypothetical protein